MKKTASGGAAAAAAAANPKQRSMMSFFTPKTPTAASTAPAAASNSSPSSGSGSSAAPMDTSENKENKASSPAPAPSSATKPPPSASAVPSSARSPPATPAASAAAGASAASPATAASVVESYFNGGGRALAGRTEVRVITTAEEAEKKAAAASAAALVTPLKSKATPASTPASASASATKITPGSALTTPTTARSLASFSSASPASASSASSSAGASPESASFGFSASGRKRRNISYAGADENDAHAAMEAEDDDDDEEAKPKSKAKAAPASKPSAGKKKKKSADSDDEDYAAPTADSDEEMSAASEHEEADEEAEEEEEEEDDEDAKPAKKGAKAAKSKAGGGAAGKKKAAAVKTEDDDGDMGGDDDAAERSGKDYNTDFLLPANRRDANKRRPGDPGYNPHTLYIDPERLKAFTPAERQYWEIKSKNMDLVLLFKIGKFYEMFDEDAAVGVKDLALSYMPNQKRPHAGFPESAIDKYCEMLVLAGHQVGRVDQTQTPEEMKAANAALPKGAVKAKSVRRELTAVMTAGTLVDPELLKSEQAVYVLAMTERELTSEERATLAAAERKLFEEANPRSALDVDIKLEPINGTAMSDMDVDEQPLGGAPRSGAGADTRRDNYQIEIGFCYCDAATGRIFLGQCYDDYQRSFTKTLFGVVNPKEIILPTDAAGVLSANTHNVVQQEVQEKAKFFDFTVDQFWSAERTVREFRAAKYWSEEKKEASASSSSSSAAPAAAAGQYAGWPGAVVDLITRDRRLALSALGALTCHLRRSMHDRAILSLGQLSDYFLYQVNSSSSPSSTSLAVASGVTTTTLNERRCMTLDGQTLSNLHILRNQKGGTAGTLLEFVDRCQSAMGKRRLCEYLKQPLYRLGDLQQRQHMVAFFMQHSDLTQSLRKQLKQLPDLERFIARIHAHSLKSSVKIIMYDVNLDRKKLDQFLLTLDGFDALIKLVRELSTFTQTIKQEQEEAGSAADPALATNSRLLQLLRPQIEGGLWPAIATPLQEMRDGFDAKLAKSVGKVQPKAGLCPEYEQARSDLAEYQARIDAYLKRQKETFRCSEIKYFHKNKDRYQVELPVKAIPSAGMPKHYTIKSSTKAVRRFCTPETNAFALEMIRLEAAIEEIELDLARRIFALFTKHHQQWLHAVDIVAELDCILSLALVSSNHPGCVRPEFIDSSAASSATDGAAASAKLTPQQGVLELRQASHPCLYEKQLLNRMTNTTNNQFIENDTVIGCAENPARFVLVSGPNMGGKSTLLRQTCCCAILAQLGCWVPASSFRLTPIDRIFTRVGANDQIMEGQSTFQVELLETSVILKNATARSLVILDELGRGTSTFDGTAIAYAVIEFLKKKGCLTLFATHYHMLLQEMASDPLVSRYHMASEVSQSCSDRVTFLYKFLPGICPKSYGNNVAVAAGLPDKIVRMAKEMSEKFEIKCVSSMEKNRRALLELFPRKQVIGVAPQLPVETTRLFQSAVKTNDVKAIVELMEKMELAQMLVK